MLKLPNAPQSSNAYAAEDVLFLPSFEDAFQAWDDDLLQLTTHATHAVPNEQSLARQDFAARLEQVRQTTTVADAVPLAERFLLIVLGTETYALALESVVEISHPLPMTPIPHVPAWFLGLVNLRGDVLSVLDAPTFWGRPTQTQPTRPRLVVLRGQRRTLRAALLVDQVREMARFTAAQKQTVAAIGADCVNGLATHHGQTVKFLDTNRLLQSSRNRQS